MKWVLFAFTAPWAVVTWFIGVLSLLGFARKIRFEGAGIMTMEWRPWVARRFGYSTTLGRLVWFHPDHRNTEAELDERVERHERVHIRQVEDLMFLSFLVGFAVAIGFWSHGLTKAGFCWWLGIWTSGGMWQLPNFITAFFRYGRKGIYRDSEHERSAYAQTAMWPNGESWWERRDAARASQKGVLR